MTPALPASACSQPHQREALAAMTGSLSFTSDRPTKEGGYWMTCEENNQEPEFVPVFWKWSKLMAKIDCGTYAVADVCGGLTDVKWAHAISVT